MPSEKTPFLVTVDPEFQSIRRQTALRGLLDLLDQLPEEAHVSPSGIASLLALAITPDQEDERG